MSKLVYILCLSICSCNIESSKETSNKTYYYEPIESTICGKIFKKGVWGPPGYGENPSEDAVDTIYFVKLKNKIDVYIDSNIVYHDNDIVDKELNIDTIQVNPASKNIIEKYVGYDVVLKGSLYHAISGNHRTKVLISVKEINSKSEAK